MDTPPKAARKRAGIASRVRLPATFLTATSLTFLKPRLKRVLRPIAARLAEAGVTANQLTVASFAGSVVVGALLCVFAAHRALFAILPIWLAMRMVCATLDGTLAVEFGQKSRLGGFLNEAGDIVSEIALLLPLGFVSPYSMTAIAWLILLVVTSELAGIVGSMLLDDRRLDGPLGKADRSIVLSVIAIAIAILRPLPDDASIVLPVLSAGSIITTWNRLHPTLAGLLARLGPS
jgi:phosphatidylglycerophosphate synthase